VDDLARFVAFELGGPAPEGFKTETVAGNFQRGGWTSGDFQWGYGVGYMLFRRGDRVIRGHGGAVAGYQAEALVDRQARIGVIVFRNVNGGKFDLSHLAFQTLELAAAAEQKAALAPMGTRGASH
jgi:CubicO group peptidase (beta-lactamase class C family)